MTSITKTYVSDDNPFVRVRSTSNAEDAYKCKRFL